MSKYARLTLARRVMIENMTLAGYTQINIGLTIGVNQSTVSRDLARLDSGTYCAKRAHAHSVTRAVVPTIVPLLDRCAELVGHLSHYLTARYSIAQGPDTERPQIPGPGHDQRPSRLAGSRPGGSCHRPAVMPESRLSKHRQRRDTLSGEGPKQFLTMHPRVNPNAQAGASC